MAPRKKHLKNMKNTIFNIIWSGIIAFFLTRLLIIVECKTNFADWYCIPAIYTFIHSLGMSVRIVVFVILTLILSATGIAKFLGNLLLWVIGGAIWLVLIALGVYIAYHALIWVAGAL